jgi:hypothetical protein
VRAVKTHTHTHEVRNHWHLHCPIYYYISIKYYTWEGKQTLSYSKFDQYCWYLLLLLFNYYYFSCKI